MNFREIDFNQLLVDNNIRNIPDNFNKSQFDNLLAIIEDFFTKSFQKANPEHPVSKLFNRYDIFSSYELATLGYAIDRFRNSNPGWLNRIICNIRDSNTNNQRGFLNELLIPSYIQENGYKLVLPKKTNIPSKDFELHGENGKKIHVSVKNLGFSDHRREFIKNCKNLEEKFYKFLNEKNYNNKMLSINFTKYGNNYMFEKILQGFKDYDSIIDKKREFQSGEVTAVSAITRLFNNTEDLFYGKINYSVAVTSNYHKNEVPNLIKPIQDEIIKLSEKDGYYLFIAHIDQFAPTEMLIDELEKVCKCCFGDKQIKNVELIVFQYYIAFSTEIKKKCLNCFIKQFPNTHYLPFALNLSIPYVSYFNTEPDSKIFITGDNGYDFSNTYMYQNGHAYIKKDLSIKIEPPEFDYGINYHYVEVMEGFNLAYALSFRKIPDEFEIL